MPREGKQRGKHRGGALDNYRSLCLRKKNLRVRSKRPPIQAAPAEKQSRKEPFRYFRGEASFPRITANGLEEEAHLRLPRRSTVDIRGETEKGQGNALLQNVRLAARAYLAILRKEGKK